ncbi:c-type cytochrome [Paenibacillus donghaensis]|uniref:Cytochrome C n=1 Tax=Paenibacillus donghaensis TaxID=414771 RepID=A0A2Z2KPS0_9BACL|nr:cytochrome c [Paenibacillus donghaensis]ASA26565.1 cytochrome C [Paenibacillus donghaensis]
MQKWIMSGLFFAACAFAIVLMFALPGKEEVAEEQKPAMPAVQLDAAAAEEVVKATCISCHGDQLQGGMGPSLQQAGAEHDAEAIYSIVTKGRGQMPSFKEQLAPEEIANVAMWLAEKK